MNTGVEPSFAKLTADCLLELGRLDGVVSALPEPVLEIFALRLAVRTVSSTLEEAGFPLQRSSPPDWLVGRSPPPLPSVHVAAPAAVICSAALDAMRWSSWAAMCAAAEQLSKMLSLSNIDPEGSGEGAWSAVEEAGQLFAGSNSYEQLDPISATMEVIDRARASVTFSPGQGDETPLDFPDGVRIVRTASPKPDSWALSLNLGQALRNAGVLRHALPLAKSIPVAALRSDLPQPERQRFLIQALTQSVRDGLDDLRQAQSFWRLASPALSGLRSSSRATTVFAAIAGAGGLRRGQVVKALGLTSPGAKVVLDTLETLGLVTPVGIGRSLIYMPDVRPQPSPVRNDHDDQALTPMYRDFDDALNELEKLLGDR